MLWLFGWGSRRRRQHPVKTKPLDGWCYVLTHPAWTKIGIVKIGMTTQDPKRRAAQITSVSGLIAPCTVHCCVYVANRRLVETTVHHRLGKYRVRRRRELFRVSPDFAAVVLRDAAR